MSKFKVIEILSPNMIRVSPKWKLSLNNTTLTGDNIKIRGLDKLTQPDIIKNRLTKLLLDSQNDIGFNSPEVIKADDHDNAVVSCSVYIAHTNILYFFPEFVYKD